LAENPDRITKMFPTDEINEEGVYAVEMTKNGYEVHIVLDDFVPCKDHRPAFSSANGNELWVLLLEKAWAKLHGSYDRIISGQAHETLRDLTGAPAYEYIVADMEAKNMFNKID
jgi:calpain-15|tara:strand:- start:99 stop:440 length:342 start_codon:yes stop_codon:yes gene_type:complete